MSNPHTDNVRQIPRDIAAYLGMMGATATASVKPSTTGHPDQALGRTRVPLPLGLSHFLTLDDGISYCMCVCPECCPPGGGCCCPDCGAKVEH